MNPGAGYESRTDLPFETILRPDAPAVPYRRRKNERKSVIHWGQRKLLLCEIEFLLLHGDKAPLVVYAGAAPGPHVKILMGMFPKHSFVCVDPAPFSKQLVENDRLILRQEMFTDDVAREFADRDVLFLSDIRSADPDIMDEKEVDSQVVADQEAQMRWHLLMKAKASLLKFRLSWKEGITNYLKGDIYLPIWGPMTTTEARLLVEGTEMQGYDNQKYEQQMFFFNTVARVARYEHDVKAVGIDFCYDCRAEVEVLRRYIKQERTADLSAEELAERVGRLSERISRELGHRTLADGNSDPGVRKQGIIQRQYIAGKPAYAKRKQHEAQYSNTAQRLMAGMGYKQGKGLGREAQGAAEPILESSQIGRRGLGFSLAGHRFDAEKEGAVNHDQNLDESGEKPAKTAKPMAFELAGQTLSTVGQVASDLSTGEPPAQRTKIQNEHETEASEQGASGDDAKPLSPSHSQAETAKKEDGEI
ncbi:uncharacterized protein MONBRDRAFT_26377 [Monosiga brevicollis MX1]|uniref:Cap-specific mRNA (nucleoside-2'-O-)-methyltransferase n=1 Tax=Monosiga brevicollis TaxID=81824 RepID=A9V270_MONBE|nr:uncharacterized protein MONBRDRAFT_26377 [Monosiga brevicollis MX1]EDQ88203.1 predicted protein [Monosiga brevicollis MX1]|eukprot:XP_001746796.1 hypothetical protein [Monosiga brevicollis MX1]